MVLLQKTAKNWGFCRVFFFFFYFKLEFMHKYRLEPVWETGQKRTDCPEKNL